MALLFNVRGQVVQVDGVGGGACSGNMCLAFSFHLAAKMDGTLPVHAQQWG